LVKAFTEVSVSEESNLKTKNASGFATRLDGHDPKVLTHTENHPEV
jgi:hypothetical protein